MVGRLYPSQWDRALPVSEHPRWPSLPDNAPDILCQSTVSVTDPNRLFLVVESQRRGNFQALIKRYVRTTASKARLSQLPLPS